MTAPIMTDDQRPLNLEQLKKRAKGLLKQIRDGDPLAYSRMRMIGKGPGNQPEFSKAEFTLADAQFVIARELKQSSWTKLKEHIAAYDRAKQLVINDSVADADISTVHIRCGSDIQQGLQLAGLHGKFIEYCDPVCQGPVRDPYDIRQRQQFIKTLGQGAVGPPPLGSDQSRLEQSLLVDRIVIWSEHDPYDVFVLARLCNYFSSCISLPRLELIFADTFPGIERFNGLGQLSPTGLRLLWEQARQEVTPKFLSVGRRVWQSICNSDPTELSKLANSSIKDMQPFTRAVMRYIQEYPWVGDGLTLTERLALGAINAGATTPGEVFRDLVVAREPLVFIGDVMFWPIIRRLAGSSCPFVDIHRPEPGMPWFKTSVELTRAGEQILDPSEPNSSWKRPGEYWQGGVRIDENCPWRYQLETTSLIKVV
ncbi:MAG: DUF1835 domain-containing protein [Cohaesibacteraceae bacterium]|nr:DUF1835 domain-containing protein [Cohaesibacteraceae bacterium]